MLKLESPYFFVFMACVILFFSTPANEYLIKEQVALVLTDLYVFAVLSV